MRKIIVALVSLTVVLLLGFSAYRAYELWKQGHWLSLAKRYAAIKDLQNERLCLKQALRYDPGNIEACRMMADASGTMAEVVAWRQKIVDLNPTSLDDRLMLVQTALLARDYKTATTALAGASDADKKTAAYYNVAGQFALASNQLDMAEADFAEAARIDPSNPMSEFSRAFVELRGSNTLDMAEARITMQRISMNSTNAIIRNQARRELVMDALRHDDYPTALSFSKELADETNAIFPDKLLRLEVLKRAKSDEFNSALAACERDAVTNSDGIFQLTLWLMQRNMPSSALSWLQNLPPNTRTNLPAALLIAQCQLFSQDWAGLQNTAGKQNWGPQESTRHAYMARAMRQQGFLEPSKAEWDLAVSDAGGRDASLTALFHLADAWGWHNEAEQLLWTIVNTYPQETWAPRVLTALLYQNGNTRPLMQLFATEVSRDPNDLGAKNNLALAAMLLNAQEMNPYELTREVYQQMPTNYLFACTYAFSLYLQGKNSDALKIMQAIPAKDLSNNSTAGYYGLILKAAGDNAQSRHYLQLSARGPLLPEEKALFQQAMTSP